VSVQIIYTLRAVLINMSCRRGKARESKIVSQPALQMQVTNGTLRFIVIIIIIAMGGGAVVRKWVGGSAGAFTGH
jgi:hypothetical protein